MGEHAIRELNDDINHKMREKWHWNRRIHELGGLDYNALEKKRQIEEGDTQLGGYRYFGAAKPAATPRYAKGAIGAISQSIQEAIAFDKLCLVAIPNKKNKFSSVKLSARNSSTRSIRSPSIYCFARSTKSPICS